MFSRPARPALAVLCLLALAAGGLVSRAETTERPPLDREEPSTVKTATFALG